MNYVSVHWTIARVLFPHLVADEGLPEQQCPGVVLGDNGMVHIAGPLL